MGQFDLKLLSIQLQHDFFIFHCISPGSFLVHMIAANSNFGLKKETISHFVKIVWKDCL